MLHWNLILNVQVFKIEIQECKKAGSKLIHLLKVKVLKFILLFLKSLNSLGEHILMLLLKDQGQEFEYRK